MRIVSGCLAGIHCRYDGETKTDPRIVAMVASGQALPVCPEQMGGLSTPRTRSYLSSRQPIRLVNDDGEDVTTQYEEGAAETVRLARLVGATEAILKEGSPSCGSCRVSIINEGEEPHEVPGEGITASRLRAEGMTVYSEENWPS